MIDVIDVLLDLETSDIATVSFEETLILTIQNKKFKQITDPFESY